MSQFVNRFLAVLLFLLALTCLGTAGYVLIAGVSLRYSLYHVGDYAYSSWLAVSLAAVCGRPGATARSSSCLTRTAALGLSREIKWSVLGRPDPVSRLREYVA
jgi:hypothetical protein